MAYNYTPPIELGKCPNCGNYPSKVATDKRFLAAKHVRLECLCGVSGAWRSIMDNGETYYDLAARGWASVFPAPRPNTPPPHNK